MTEEDLNRAIGKRLREARLSMVPRMTQATLGRVLGVSFQMVQKYESGACRLSGGALILAARALKLPPGFLLVGFEED